MGLVRVHLTRHAQRLLRRDHRLHVELVARLHNRTGSRWRSATSITLVLAGRY
jgi:hypothetical protein